MIFIRDDDVLMRSREPAHADAFSMFKRIHEIIQTKDDKVFHIPAILVTEIQSYPECIEYIARETEAGRMSPQIHGFQHIDYSKLPGDVVARDLAHCIKFNTDNFGVRPTKFYTPWGKKSNAILEACNVLDLEMVDTSYCRKLYGRYGAWQMIKKGHDINEEWAGQDIIIHWYADAERLEEVLKRI